jgi:hypothetical protein
MTEQLPIESRVALAIRSAMVNKPGMLLSLREELLADGWNQFAINQLIQQVGIMVFNETPNERNTEK